MVVYMEFLSRSLSNVASFAQFRNKYNVLVIIGVETGVSKRNIV